MPQERRCSAACTDNAGNVKNSETKTVVLGKVAIVVFNSNGELIAIHQEWEEHKVDIPIDKVLKYTFNGTNVNPS